MRQLLLLLVSTICAGAATTADLVVDWNAMTPGTFNATALTNASTGARASWVTDQNPTVRWSVVSSTNLSLPSTIVVSGVAYTDAGTNWLKNDTGVVGGGSSAATQEEDFHLQFPGGADGTITNVAVCGFIKVSVPDNNNYNLDQLRFYASYGSFSVMQIRPFASSVSYVAHSQTGGGTFGNVCTGAAQAKCYFYLFIRDPIGELTTVRWYDPTTTPYTLLCESTKDTEVDNTYIMDWVSGYAQQPAGSILYSRQFFFYGASYATLFGIVTNRVGDIPADRLYDWTKAGVRGGIPNRATIYTNFYSTNTIGEINAGIANCPSNQVVYLNAGSYALSDHLVIAKDGVTVRGAGPTSTILINTTTHAYPVEMYRASQEAGNYRQFLSTDLAKGGTNMSLGTATNIHVGSTLRLIQAQDGVLVVTNATAGNGYSLGQIVEVQSVSGTDLTFSPPAVWWYSNSLNAYVDVLTPVEQNYYTLRMSGLEDLQITNSAYTTSEAIIFMLQAAVDCWVKNVEMVRTPGYHLVLNRCLFCEVRDSYFHDAVNFGSSQGYGVLLWRYTTACKVENNLVDRSICPFMTELSSSGNVLGYNCSMQTIQGTTGGLDDWMAQAFNATHGSHSMMNLWEGNVGCEFLAENYFGSGSHQTLLRNWLHASSAKEGGGWVGLVRRAVSIDAHNYYYNVIGNVLGNTYDAVDYYEMTAGTTVHPVIYRIGWPNMGNDSTTGYDSVSLSTLIRHGNWDTITDSQQWDAGITNRTIPDSYYLSGKPAWFGSLTWPPFNPASVDTAKLYPLTPTNIPAGYRYVYGVTPAASGGGGTNVLSVGTARMGTFRTGN